MEVVNVGKPEGVLVRLPLVPPVGPLDSPAVVEFGRGYGGDTVGLNNGVSVLPVPDAGSVPPVLDETAVEVGRPDELVSVKGAGLRGKE